MENNLFVVPSLIVGGSEKVQYIALKEFLQNNKFCIVYFLSNKGELNSSFWSDPELKDSIIISKSNSEALGFVYLFLFVFRSKYDTLFTSNTHINGFLCLCRWLRVFRCNRYVVRESTDVFNRFSFIDSLKFRISHYFYFASDLIVLQHLSMYNIFINRYPFFIKKTRIILNPILKGKKSNNISKDDNVNILMVGRLDANKNHILAIQAFMNLLLIDNKFTLTIVGSGKEFLFLNSFIVDNGLEKKVFLISDYMQVDLIYKQKAFQIFLHTSFFEGFPNSIIEAMYYGVDLVISTNSNSYLSNLPFVRIVDFNPASIVKVLLEFISSGISFRENYKNYVNQYHDSKEFYNKLFLQD